MSSSRLLLRHNNRVSGRQIAQVLIASVFASHIDSCRVIVDEL